jgi:hypothetical protein
VSVKRAMSNFKSVFDPVGLPPGDVSTKCHDIQRSMNWC